MAKYSEGKRKGPEACEALVNASAAYALFGLPDIPMPAADSPYVADPHG